MANGNSSESTQRELSNEYQHERVQMVFNFFCVIVLWMKVALALEGLIQEIYTKHDQMSLSNVSLALSNRLYLGDV